MADVAPAAAPQNIPLNPARMRIDTTTPPPPPDEATRKGDLGLGVFSPVNQNGSFEFDRVLKSGELLKRTRKTKVRNFPRARCTGKQPPPPPRLTPL